jgi:hypothetical protein
MKRTGLLVLALAMGLLSAGCVTRRVLITSEPSGATVFYNGQPIGTTPVDMTFTYYGIHRFRLERDGCEPADFERPLYAPWFQWFGVDFLTENFVPYNFRDRQVLHFDLPPARAYPHEQIRARATELQEQAKNLHAHPGAQPPPRRPQPAPAPTPPVVAPGPPLISERASSPPP